METVSYDSIHKVISSWELVRQRHSTEEEIGTLTLIRLFEKDEASMAPFGLRGASLAELKGPKPSMNQMGLLIHGSRIIKLLDTVLASLGPDNDVLTEILAEEWENNCLESEKFGLLGDALTEIVSELLADSWDADLSTAWKHVNEGLALELTRF